MDMTPRLFDRASFDSQPGFYRRWSTDSQGFQKRLSVESTDCDHGVPKVYSKASSSDKIQVIRPCSTGSGGFVTESNTRRTTMHPQNVAQYEQQVSIQNRNAADCTAQKFQETNWQGPNKNFPVKNISHNSITPRKFPEVDLIPRERTTVWYVHDEECENYEDNTIESNLNSHLHTQCSNNNFAEQERKNVTSGMYPLSKSALPRDHSSAKAVEKRANGVLDAKEVNRNSDLSEKQMNDSENSAVLCMAGNDRNCQQMNSEKPNVEVQTSEQCLPRNDSDLSANTLKGNSSEASLSTRIFCRESRNQSPEAGIDCQQESPHLTESVKMDIASNSSQTCSKSEGSHHAEVEAGIVTNMQNGSVPSCVELDRSKCSTSGSVPCKLSSDSITETKREVVRHIGHEDKLIRVTLTNKNNISSGDGCPALILAAMPVNNEWLSSKVKSAPCLHNGDIIHEKLVGENVSSIQLLQRRPLVRKLPDGPNESTPEKYLKYIRLPSQENTRSQFDEYFEDELLENSNTPLPSLVKSEISFTDDSRLLNESEIADSKVTSEHFSDVGVKNVKVTSSSEREFCGNHVSTQISQCKNGIDNHYQVAGVSESKKTISPATPQNNVVLKTDSLSSHMTAGQQEYGKTAEQNVTVVQNNPEHAKQNRPAHLLTHQMQHPSYIDRHVSRVFDGAKELCLPR